MGEQLTIARNLVDLTQALTDGGLGITHYDEFATSGITRTAFICVEERKTVADSFDELCAADDGFDFVVSPAKVLRLYYPRRGVSTTVTFSGDENMSDFSYQVDATELTTQVAAVGPQEDCGIPFLYVATDAAARTTYGLLQSHVEGGDIKDTDQLEAMADEQLRISTTPRFQPDVVVSTDLQEAVLNGVAFEDYEIGDAVTLETTRGAAGGFGYFNQTFRVTSRDVTVRRPGIEDVTLKLDSVVAA